MKRPITNRFKQFKKEKEKLLGPEELQKGVLNRYLGDVILGTLSLHQFRKKCGYNPIDFTDYSDKDIDEYVKFILFVYENGFIKHLEKTDNEFTKDNNAEQNIRRFLTTQKEVFQKYAKLYWSYHKSFYDEVFDPSLKFYTVVSKDPIGDTHTMTRVSKDMETVSKELEEEILKSPGWEIVSITEEQ